MLHAAVQDGDRPHPVLHGVDAVEGLGDHAPGDEAAVHELPGPAHVHPGDAGGLVLAVHQDAVGVGEEDQLVRLHRLGHRPGGVVGVAVAGPAVLSPGDGGDHRQEAGVQQGVEEGGVHLGDGAHPAQGGVLLPGGDEAAVPAGDAAGPSPDLVQGGHHGLVDLGGEGHLGGVQHRLVGDPVALLELGGHPQPVQERGDLLAAPVDQHHPDPHGLEGGGVLQDGVSGGGVQGGPAVFDDDGLPLVPAQEGEDVQQGPDLAHAVHTVLHIVFMEIFFRVLHVGGGINILDTPLLPGLGPLAGEEDDRGLLAAHHRQADGLSPVGDDGVVAVFRLHIPGDVPADVLHGLLPGVLLGEDDQVGVLPGDLPQVLPAVVGLVARAAEDRDDPPAGILLLDGLEEGLEAHPVVGVVHDDGDLLVGVGVDLHPPRDPGLHEAGVGVLLGDAQGLAHRQGGQGVLDVEEAGHGQPELPAVPGGLHPEEDVPPGLPHLGAKDGGGGVLLGEGDDPGAGLPGGLQDPVGVVGVQVDAGGGGLAEDPELGGEVVLKVRVLDGGDVVQADVQEDGGGELHVHHPVILQGLAGDLHGEVAHFALHSVGEVAL